MAPTQNLQLPKAEILQMNLVLSRKICNMSSAGLAHPRMGGSEI